MFPPRELPSIKLGDIHDDLTKRANSHSAICEAKSLKVHIAEHNCEVVFPVESKGRKKQHKVVATVDAFTTLGNLCQVPTPFIKRIDADVKAMLLNALLQKLGTSLVEVKYNDDYGIVAIEDPEKKPLDPRSIIEVAARVIGEDARVVEWWLEPAEFRLDVCQPTGKVRGKGGAVDDITLNGLRFGQNVKTKTAPWVQGYLHRKVCTNGYECEDAAGVFDARGLTVEDVLDELEASAKLILGRGPDRINAFYDLRNETVENPERILLRMAREQGIAPRFAEPMVTEQLPPILDPHTGHTTMFDLVNLITNQALNPSLTNKAGSRRKLEQAGGAIVTEHVERCLACQTRLN